MHASLKISPDSSIEVPDKQIISLNEVLKSKKQLPSQQQDSSPENSPKNTVKENGNIVNSQNTREIQLDVLFKKQSPVPSVRSTTSHIKFDFNLEVDTPNSKQSFHKESDQIKFHETPKTIDFPKEQGQKPGGLPIKVKPSPRSTGKQPQTSIRPSNPTTEVISLAQERVIDIGNPNNRASVHNTIAISMPNQEQQEATSRNNDQNPPNSSQEIPSNVLIEPFETNSNENINDLNLRLILSEEVRNKYKWIVFFSGLQVLIFALLYLGTIEKVKVEVLIGLCAVWPIVECIQVGSKINRNDYRIKTKRFKYFLLSDWLYLLLFIVLCAIKINHEGVQPTFVVIPGFINVILYFEPIPLPFGHRSNIIILKLTLWTQALLLGAKLDGRSQLSWGASFFAIWVVLVIFIVIACFYFLFFLVILYNTSRGRDVFANMSVGTQRAGILWHLMISATSVFHFVALVGFTSYLDGTESGLRTMKLTSQIGFYYSCALMCLTLLGARYIKQFIQVTVLQRITTGNGRRNLKMIISFAIEPITRPMYYSVVSQTYFMPLKDSWTKKSKEEIDQLKNKIKEMKSGFMKRIFPKKGELAREKIQENLKKKPVVKKEEGIKSMQELEWVRRENNGQQEEHVALSDKKVAWSSNDLNKWEDPNKETPESIAETECFICCVKKADAVFLECGHAGMCIECAQEAWKKQNNCVTCRKPILHIAKMNLVKGMEIGQVSFMIKKMTQVKQENILNFMR